MHSVILVHSYIMNIHVIQTHYLIWVNSKLFCACLYSNCKRLVLKLQMNTSFIKSWNVLAPILHISTAPMSYCKICASRNAQSCMQGILNSAVCITSHEKRISKKEQKKKKKVCNPLRGSSQRTGCPNHVILQNMFKHKCTRLYGGSCKFCSKYYLPWEMNIQEGTALNGNKTQIHKFERSYILSPWGVKP